MSAKRRLLAAVFCAVLILSVGAPTIGGQTAETPTDDRTSTPADTEEPNGGTTDDGVIEACTTIREPGRYELASDIEHDGSEVCLAIEANGVTVDGNGHTLQGERDDSIGIRTTGDWNGDRVRLVDLRLVHWGEIAVDNRRPSLVIEDTQFATNTRGYEGTEARGVEMDSVEFVDSYSAAISGQRMGEVRLHDVRVVDGQSGGFSTIDGADVRITNSEFSGNDGTGIHFGHSTAAEVSNTEITDNGGNGVLVASAGHSVDVGIEDSTITDNGKHGVHAAILRTDRGVLTIEETLIDDNREKALFAYEEGRRTSGGVLTVRDVDLGGGLGVTFENQFVTIGTHGADDFETDALNFSGPADADITSEFTVGADEGRLWAETGEGWQQRGTYSTSDGAFEEVVGPGTWAATGGTQSTPTDTTRETDTPATTPGDSGGGETPGSDDPPQETDPRTETPHRSPPASTEQRGTETEGVTDGTDEPADSQPTQTGAMSTPDGEPPETEDTDVGRTRTDAGTEEDDASGDRETESDDGVSMDGPGFGALPALIAVLGSSLLIRRRA